MATTHPGLSGSPPLPSMSGGIEVYVAESRYMSDFPLEPSTGGSTSTDRVFVGHTVLVNFSTDIADRESTAVLHDAVQFADCSSVVYAGADWPTRLAERLRELQTDFVSAVVYIGSQPDVVAETVQLAIDALHHRFDFALAAVTVVSEATDRWFKLRGVTGFVCSTGSSTSGETARTAFLVMATLTAPNTLNGIDVLDLLPVLGTARSPTKLAQALWLPERGGLDYLSGADEECVSQAARVVATVFVRGLSWRELARINAAIRKGASTASSVICFAPQEALRQTALSERVGWLALLCLPREAAP